MQILEQGDSLKNLAPFKGESLDGAIELKKEKKGKHEIHNAFQRDSFRARWSRGS